MVDISSIQKCTIFLAKAIIIICILELIVISYQTTHDKNEQLSNAELQNFLDGCHHVYLDVGSNIGVQIRKLFEPERYPDAPIHSYFNQNFGTIEKRKSSHPGPASFLCAIGFEPNPRHVEYLKQIEKSYNECGWKVKFMTNSGVSDHNGIGTFYSNVKQEKLLKPFKGNELAGGILPPTIIKDAKNHSKDNKGLNFKNISVIRLSDFLINIVGRRKIPEPFFNNSPPRVVMKMDIEGSEVDVIPDLIYSGGLQYINTLMIEWHERREKLQERKTSTKILQIIMDSLSKHSENIRNLSTKYDFNLVELDDETYSNSRFVLPNCSNSFS